GGQKARDAGAADRQGDRDADRSPEIIRVIAGFCCVNDRILVMCGPGRWLLGGGHAMGIEDPSELGRVDLEIRRSALCGRGPDGFDDDGCPPESESEFLASMRLMEEAPLASYLER